MRGDRATLPSHSSPRLLHFQRAGSEQRRKADTISLSPSRPSCHHIIKHSPFSESDPCRTTVMLRSLVATLYHSYSVCFLFPCLSLSRHGHSTQKPPFSRPFCSHSIHSVTLPPITSFHSCLYTKSSAGPGILAHELSYNLLLGPETAPRRRLFRESHRAVID